MIFGKACGKFTKGTKHLFALVLALSVDWTSLGAGDRFHHRYGEGRLRSSRAGGDGYGRNILSSGLTRTARTGQQRELFRAFSPDRRI